MKSLDNMCSAGTKYPYLHNIGLTVVLTVTKTQKNMTTAVHIHKQTVL